MKKKVLVLSAVAGMLVASPLVAKAEEVKEGDNIFYVVEKGDTLSKIAENYDTTFFTIHNNNLDEISHVDHIDVGQKFLVGGKDFDDSLSHSTLPAEPVVVTYTAPETNEAVVYDSSPVVQEQPVAQSAPAPATPSNDNWHKANRRMVESTDNYNTFTGNGYYGAYQFAPGTWNSIASRHGLDASDFSPANQDRFADIYAQERYGGWQNVPTSGGW